MSKANKLTEYVKVADESFALSEMKNYLFFLKITSSILFFKNAFTWILILSSFSSVFFATVSSFLGLSNSRVIWALSSSWIAKMIFKTFLLSYEFLSLLQAFALKSVLSLSVYFFYCTWILFIVLASILLSLYSISSGGKMDEIFCPCSIRTLLHLQQSLLKIVTSFLSLISRVLSPFWGA